MTWRVRRVLTGHDRDGKSTIIADGPAPNVKEMPSFPGLALTDLWETASAPADNSGQRDAADRPIRLEPPKNGTIFRIVEFPPDASRPRDSDGSAGFKAIGASHAQDRSSSDPMMHKTSTIDYIVVLKARSTRCSRRARRCSGRATSSSSAAPTIPGACAATSRASSRWCW